MLPDAFVTYVPDCTTRAEGVMTVTSPADIEPHSKTPVGVRVAGIFAGAVGAFTLLTAFTVGIPALNPYTPLGWLRLSTAVVGGAGACAAAVLIWRRHRSGVLVLVLAWAVPTFATLAIGEQASGNVFLTGSLLLAAANWSSLR